MKTVPMEQVFAPLMASCLQLTQSKKVDERKGGFIVLAILAESRTSLLTDKLEAYLVLICESIKDTDKLVRAAACVALTQFADCVQPDILRFHSVPYPHRTTPIVLHP